MLVSTRPVGSRLSLQAFGRSSGLACRKSAIAMAKDALAEADTTGAFKRTDATFRSQISPGSEFEPEAGRYVLYVSYACPWANRCLATRNLKGLQDAIDVSIVHPTWQRTRPNLDEHYGWAFAHPDDEPFSNPNGYGKYPPDGCIPDSTNGAKFVRDLYEIAGNDPGKYTVPILWDKNTNMIVNNESSEIIRIFNSQFNSVAKNPSLDLYPEDLKDQIEDVNSWVYPCINNGVYRCGFATAQEPYETAFQELFAALDKVEGILGEQRYVAGNKLTEADIRLFMTLIRFDPVYVVYFKTNRQFIHQYPNMKNYVQELYNMEGIKESINMYHIKTHYFTSHAKLNYYGIVPLGCDEWWTDPQHNRSTTQPL
eukprot:jgi/Ulvmu1/4882/UM020_0168.1